MDFILYVLTLAGFFAVIALSLDLITGYTGVPAFGHAAFPLVGAYVSALCSIHLGLPSILGVLIGSISAALLGILCSAPALRVHGDYLALVTLGLGLIAEGTAENLLITRGPMGLSGIPSLSIFSVEVTSPTVWLLIVYLLVLAVYLFLGRLTNDSFGRVLVAIRDDEVAVQALSRNPAVGKIRAFALGAFIGGAAGALYAHYASFITPEVFGVRTSVMLLLMVVCGGAGTLRGPILGALLVTCLPAILRILDIPPSVEGPLRQFLYGAGLVLVVVLRPEGLVGSYSWGSNRSATR